MKRRSRIWLAVAGLLALTLGWLVASFQTLARKDEEHARFHAMGSSINGFLRSYCDALEEAFDRGEATPVLRRYAPEYRSPGRGGWQWREPIEEPGALVQRREPVGRGDFGLVELEAEILDYLGDLAAIEHTTCKIDTIEDFGPEDRVILTVKHILDGEDRDGRLIQDRLFFRWHLRKTGSGEGPAGWRIARDELVEGVRSSGQGRALTQLDPRALGIDFEHRRDPRLDKKRHADRLRFGVIEHASGGLSAADFDRDGRPDLFFLDGLESHLYRNEGTDEEGLPRFADVTAESGLAGIDQAHAAVFADFDNDGDRDLFVGRFLAPSRYYRNLGDGTFEDASDAAGVGGLVEPVTGITLLDYDRDGFVDLYLGVNGNPFEHLPRLPFFARNGEPNRLFRNVGGERFEDVTERSGTGDTGWALAVAAGDYDGDGSTDLAVANDFGRKRLYRNNGDGTFTDRAKDAGVLDFGGGMGLAFGDYDGDGLADLYTSNINSNQRWFGEETTVSQYVRNVVRTRWFLADLPEYWALYRLLGDAWVDLGRQIGEGNSLFRNSGDGTFREVHDSGAVRAGWGWGVALLDLENDADLDIFAANGWISGTPGTDL